MLFHLPEELGLNELFEVSEFIKINPVIDNETRSLCSASLLSFINSFFGITL
jgi:hypothetical protein